MEKTQITESVPKELHELNQGLLELTIAVKAALADGWQAEKDLPAIVMAAIQKLGPAVQGMDSIPAETKLDPSGAVLSGGWLVSKLLAVFNKAA